MLDIQFTEEFLICYKNDAIDVNVHIPVIPLKFKSLNYKQILKLTFFFTFKHFETFKAGNSSVVINLS